jgi:hypothetical protein
MGLLLCKWRRLEGRAVNNTGDMTVPHCSDKLDNGESLVHYIEQWPTSITAISPLS